MANVNTQKPEAQSRMLAIMVPRHDKDRDIDKAKGTFVIRIPSYNEIPRWRDTVVKGIDILFSDLKEKKNSGRSWVSGGNNHVTKVFENDSVSFKEALKSIIDRIPEAMEIVYKDDTNKELLKTNIEKIHSLLSQQYNIMLTQNDSKTMTQTANDILSKTGCLLQAPFVIPVSMEENERNDSEMMYNLISSGEYGSKVLSRLKSMNALHTHVFGVSPFQSTCTDYFKYDEGKKGKDGPKATIKFGWDFMINARPAADIIKSMLSQGDMFGENLRMRTIVTTPDSDPKAGDPLQLRNIFGLTFEIEPPDAVKGRGLKSVENFFVFLQKTLSNYMNFYTVPENFAKRTVANLSEDLEELMTKTVKKIDEASDLYAKKRLEFSSEMSSRTTEHDTEPRAIPFTNSPQIYLNFQPDKEKSAKIVKAIQDYVAADGEMEARIRVEPGSSYHSAYLRLKETASDDHPMRSLAGRYKVAEQFTRFAREQAEVDLAVKLPNDLAVVLKAGGIAGKKGEIYFKLEVPKIFDGSEENIKESILPSSENIEVPVELDMLYSVREVLEESCKGGRGKKGLVIPGLASEDGKGKTMEFLSSGDNKDIWGVNVTSLGRGKQELEPFIEKIVKFTEEFIFEKALKKTVELRGISAEEVPLPDVSVKWGFEEKQKQEEKELLKNLSEWRNVLSGESMPSPGTDDDMDYIFEDDAYEQEMV